MFRTIFFILWCFPTTSYLACSLTAYSLSLYIHPFDSSLSKHTSHTIKIQEHAPSLMYSTNTLACIACYCSRHEGPCLSLKHVNWSGGYVSPSYVISHTTTILYNHTITVYNYAISRIMVRYVRNTRIRWYVAWYRNEIVSCTEKDSFLCNWIIMSKLRNNISALNHA